MSVHGPRIAFAGADGEARDASLARPVRERLGTRGLVVVGLLVVGLLAGALVWANHPGTNAAIAGSTAIST